MTPLDKALAAARRAAAGPPRSAPPDGRPRRFRVAMGDPQAPVETVLAVLAHHRLLDGEGRLRPEVHLVCVGDHFDWGSPGERARAASSGLQVLAWLAAHPVDQVTLLAGNHDLARVGELVSYDDTTFAAAQADADRVYLRAPRDAAEEAAFRARHPQVPGAEVLARDLSTFRAEQRAWVAHLLREGRLRLAAAEGPALLVTHAGVTADELAGVGLPAEAHADAPWVAAALNRALAVAVARWRGEPLEVPGLHRPGSGAGEGGGMLYHRATLRPEDAPLWEAPPPRRRFHPRRLPPGLTQVVGHVRDRKCRALLLGSEAGARDGVLRTLRVRGEEVTYGHGTPGASADAQAATVLYVDGGMREVPPATYALLDLTTLQPWQPPPAWAQGEG